MKYLKVLKTISNISTAFCLGLIVILRYILTPEQKTAWFSIINIIGAIAILVVLVSTGLRVYINKNIHS